MRWHDLYIAGTGVALPPARSVDDAVSSGRFTSAEAARTQQITVTIADPGQSAPELAVTAARDALASSGHSPAEIGALLHAVVFHSGIDVWNAPAYIQRRLQIPAGRRLVSEVRSECDGGLVALELAALYLGQYPQPAALVTAGDVWPDPVFDRWSANSGLVFADGAAAIVLSRERGFARLVATCTAIDPELEELDRGDEPFGAFLHHSTNPIDLNDRVRSFFRGTMPKAEFWRRHRLVLGEAVTGALADADTSLTAMRSVATQFLGADMLRRETLVPLGIDFPATTFEWGQTIGHLGAADVLVGLHKLRESGHLSPHDQVLMLAEGGGLICTAAVVEVL
jgi:3-oxoacyl-[acyl-carrier-protein] synthase-3